MNNGEHHTTKDISTSVGSLGDAFDPHSSLSHGHCSCNHEHHEHKESSRPVVTQDDIIDRAVENSVMRAVFGDNESTRRHFLKLVGSGAALALLADIFPLEKAKAWAKDDPGKIEKPDLKIGFIPITCATPIIMAHPLGYYEKYGLKNAEVVKASGWAMIRDWAINKQTDCTHMLSPMPLAITMGAGSQSLPFLMPAIENINGQAITLHLKHKGVKSAKDMKGFTFAVPFDYSMHNFLLRHFLAEGGINPDTDVKIRVLPPPEMVANLKAQNLDGYLSPDPFNQRAVYEGAGFIYKLSKDIWPGHPCCAFATSREFATTMPNSFKAVFKAIVDATHYAHKAENRKSIAEAIAPRNYLNQPLEVVEQVLTGKFPDGLGTMHNVPDRIDFDPFPWQSMAVWILTQMKRWGYVKGDVNYKKIAEEVFLASDCAKFMKELGYKAPSTTYKKHTIMGKGFDASNPEEYLKGFAITSERPRS
jgi:nitrate/nitrite transport system substrate-binding protein